MPKTKQEILKMTKEEMQEYRQSDILEDNKTKENVDCQGCQECEGCQDCQGCWGCQDCWGCQGCWGCQDCQECEGCQDCQGCVDCLGCQGCVDCYMCRNAKGLKYAICNVEVGKEAYEAKIKELCSKKS